MYILITDTGDQREILQASANPLIAGAGQEVREINGEWPGVSKSECYWNEPTQTIELYTPAELLEIYREYVLDDCNIKALDIIQQYNYKINYYNNKIDRGDTLTIDEQTDLALWQDKYIQGVDWIAARRTAIEAAIDYDGINIEYDKVKAKYEAKKERVI